MNTLTKYLKCKNSNDYIKGYASDQDLSKEAEDESRKDDQ